MRVLITGINGFTGVYLEKLLRSYDFQVFGTTIDEPLKDTHLKCDITNIDDVQEVLNEIRPDYIIHLAAISFVASDPMKTYKVNLAMAVAMAVAMATAMAVKRPGYAYRGRPPRKSTFY